MASEELMSNTKFGRVRTAAGVATFAKIEGNQALFLTDAPWDGGQLTGQSAALDTVTALAPMTPSKVIGIGRNYRAHAAELGHDLPSEPLIFLKPPSCVQGPNALVVLPKQSERVDFEAELGVVIGKRARNVNVEQALQYVFGYTAVCDVTARDLQKKDDQWTRAKGFDTFCPAGPWLVQGLEPGNLAIQLRQNGVLKQDGNTNDMIFSVPRLIAHISGIMTLEPGDLIATGTPSGVAPMQPGDRIVISIANVGELGFAVTAS
jgi:2-keto-4-pentenoate hydratase/2-oxohepta-3-ene-1,7-dioic acid hydratase in catechol pathway